jgi:hypothetical protein
LAALARIQHPHIRSELARSEKAHAGAVGQVLGDAFKKRDREIAALQKRVAKLEAAERAKPLRAVS